VDDDDHGHDERYETEQVHDLNIQRNPRKGKRGWYQVGTWAWTIPLEIKEHPLPDCGDLAELP